MATLIRPSAKDFHVPANTAEFTENNLKTHLNFFNKDNFPEYFTDFEHKKGIPIFQWCSASKNIKLYYPDGVVNSGLVEDNIDDLDNAVVQFERTGFVRL